MTTQVSFSGLTVPALSPAPVLSPFLKWPGGKSSELPAIAAMAPGLTGRLVDPFVGGGSVLLATPPEVRAWANDACEDLMRLYRGAACNDRLLRASLESLGAAWAELTNLTTLYEELGATFIAGDGVRVDDLLTTHLPAVLDIVGSAGPGLVEPYRRRVERDLPKKFARMRRVQADVGRKLSEPDLLANVEGAIRAAMYMAIRHRYNEARTAGSWDDHRSTDFLFLREFAYAAMFRFNARDEFNVPYGGVSYNRKPLLTKVQQLYSPLMIERLAATEWRSLDFEPFLAEAAPTVDDFVFVDPPYDSEFSAYDNKAFDWRDQERLRDTLERLPARVMVVIKDTPVIRRLYGSDRWHIIETPKTYMWTIKSRNDRAAVHLTITNYEPRGLPRVE